MSQPTVLITGSRQASHSAVIEFLRDQRHYPEPTHGIEVIETHFAWIFLTDEHAYKLKKPVRRGCMDYRTVAARRRVCCDELTLNRRLAPTVYLGIEPITRARDGTLALGQAPRGRVVDWVVRMRRLPAARMLDRAIAEHRVHKKDLLAVASRLTRFFDSSVRQPLSESRYVERLFERTVQNQRDLFAPDLGLDKQRVAEIAGMQISFLAKRELLVGTRARDLIDGHGDLRPEHVYLGSGSDAPCVIDCLEFDADLRWLDPAEEMAFLALECRSLGAPAAARTLLSHFQGASLAPASEALMDFYTSQCAMTRAKLAAWHLRDPSLTSHAAKWRARAQTYLVLASRYIRRALRKPRLSRTGSAFRLQGPVSQQWRDGVPGQHPSDRLSE